MEISQDSILKEVCTYPFKDVFLDCLTWKTIVQTLVLFQMEEIFGNILPQIIQWDLFSMLHVYNMSVHNSKQLISPLIMKGMLSYLEFPTGQAHMGFFWVTVLFLVSLAQTWTAQHMFWNGFKAGVNVFYYFLLIVIFKRFSLCSIEEQL